MRRRHILALAVLAAGLATGTAAGPILSPEPAEARPLREVAAGRVTAMVPEPWQVRHFPHTDSRIGIRAFPTTADREGGSVGLEAYWVDATEVGIPSDYYYLAAEGAATPRISPGAPCERETQRVLADRPPSLDRLHDSPGHFVATSSGVCQRGDRLLRWTSFVAAPGFGPVRLVGIPESGLYHVFVTVAAGPQARERMHRMLSRVSFGGAPVPELLRAAGWRGRVL